MPFAAINTSQEKNIGADQIKKKNESFFVLKNAMQSHPAGYTQVQTLVLLLSNSLGKLFTLFKLYFCYYKNIG